MRTRTIHMSVDGPDHVSLERYFMNGASNDEARLRMKRVMSKAIRNGLTEKQRYCLTEKYLNKRSQKEIAGELGVDESTVSRHISAAVKKLRNIASYYS